MHKLDNTKLRNDFRDRLSQNRQGWVDSVDKKNGRLWSMPQRYSYAHEKMFFDLVFHKFNVRRGVALDLGCGYGFFTNLLSDMGFDSVYGVDLDFERITDAAKNYDKNFLLGDSMFPPFPNKTFDLVLCRGLSTFSVNLDHAHHAHKLKRIILQLVKEGGILLFIQATDLSGKKTTIQNHKIEDVLRFFGDGMEYPPAVYFFFGKRSLARLRGSVFSSPVTYLSSLFARTIRRSGYVVCVVKVSSSGKSHGLSGNDQSPLVH